MMSRVGVLFSRKDDLALVELAERLGYESAWSSEGQGRSAFGKLERWATTTDEIGLATGIVNTYARTPAALAQAVATLDAHSDGRAILGLGVAHPGVVKGFHGSAFERPLPRLEEYITLIRRYLRGEAVSFDGEFFSPERTSFWDGFEPVREEIPIYNAALGPQNVRLTGAHADGWLPNLYPRSALERGLSWLETGAERTGRDAAEVDVAMYVLTVVNDDPDAAYRCAAEHVAYYLREIPGYYSRVAEETGFEDDVAAVQSAGSLDDAVAALSRGFLDVVAIAGTREQVHNELDALREAGVALPIVRAPINAPREAVERLLRACAPE